jgi:hypothetical protein
MNMPDPAPDTAADQALRASMQRSLARSPAHGLDNLRTQVVAQWRQRAPGEAVVTLGTTAGWQPPPRAWVLAALAVAAAALLLMNTASDPSVDELMQPDVLSLISLGEL